MGIILPHITSVKREQSQFCILFSVLKTDVWYEIGQLKKTLQMRIVEDAGQPPRTRPAVPRGHVGFSRYTQLTVEADENQYMQ